MPKRSKEAGREEARRLYQLPEKCDECEDPPYDRHHKNGDTNNNSQENIAFLCRRCHMVADGRLAKFKELAETNIKKSRSTTHCAQGHPFDQENTRWHKGKRHCRKCHAERARRHKIKKRDQNRQLLGEWRSGRWWTEESKLRHRQSIDRRTMTSDPSGMITSGE